MLLKPLHHFLEFSNLFKCTVTLVYVNFWPTGIVNCTCSYLSVQLWKDGFGCLGWLMMEVKHNRRRSVLKMVENHSQTTLIPIIRRHVRSGSTILSDCWSVYVRSLNRLGYNHQTVDHTNNAVDPHTRCHTQHIERAWQTIKELVGKLKGIRTKKKFKEASPIYWEDVQVGKRK